MTDKPMRIAVVDDDTEMRELLERYLGENGLSVVTTNGGAGLNRLLGRERFACIVLDLMMPGEDGLAICRRLREAGDATPIIMLTARGGEIDRIVGLEMGVDDYLPKPFNPRELLARITALIRRSRYVPPPGAPIRGDVLRFAGCELDPARRTLRKGATETRLSSGEFAVLEALASRPGRVLSREQLLDLTRGGDLDVLDRSIDVQVHRLRRLVEDDPSHPKVLQTVRGHGYCIAPEPEAP